MRATWIAVEIRAPRDAALEPDVGKGATVRQVSALRELVKPRRVTTSSEIQIQEKPGGIADLRRVVQTSSARRARHARALKTVKAQYVQA